MPVAGIRGNLLTRLRRRTAFHLWDMRVQRLAVQRGLPPPHTLILTEKHRSISRLPHALLTEPLHHAVARAAPRRRSPLTKARPQAVGPQPRRACRVAHHRLETAPMPVFRCRHDARADGSEHDRARQREPIRLPVNEEGLVASLEQGPTRPWRRFARGVSTPLRCRIPWASLPSGVSSRRGSWLRIRQEGEQPPCHPLTTSPRIDSNIARSSSSSSRASCRSPREVPWYRAPGNALRNGLAVLQVLPMLVAHATLLDLTLFFSTSGWGGDCLA